jgi:hypothetical protein
MKPVRLSLSLVVSLAVSVTAATPRQIVANPPGGIPNIAAVGAAGLTEAWRARAGDIDAAVFALGLQATHCAVQLGDLPVRPRTLTIIDYSKPSTTERLWVFDLTTRAMLYRELVAHGRGSGENMATNFSNEADSHRSSLGLFMTDDAYVGKNGYSLRLNGLEPGVNDHARDRAIVMHGAPYVNETLAFQQGRLGRRWGCPALRDSIARNVIDQVKGGGAVFAYYPDPHWLRTSKYLNGCTSAAASAAHH